jgi:broad specificity phosphatase PhoE
MTTLFLVRHAAHALIGRVLTGRMPGVSIGAEGQRQAERLAERLSREAISAVYTSPLERAQQTAAPIAARLTLRPEIVEAMTDVDYGEWSGRRFEELDGDPRWKGWNEAKATYRPPGGETLLDVQWRAISGLEALVAAHRGAGAVVVSHCDVIKAILAYHLGIAIEGIARFEISPASVSTVVVEAWGAKVHSMNEIVST